MKKKIIISLIFFYTLSVNHLFSQVEHIVVQHPVYQFLEYAYTKGILENFSLSTLPLQRKEIQEALKVIRLNDSSLSETDKKTLSLFEKEFELSYRQNATIFFSKSDTNQLLFSRIFTDDEKYIYRYSDSSSSVSLIPLGSIENINKINNKNEFDKVFLGNLGFRLYGTIDNSLGYGLQVTNGVVLAGTRNLAIEESKITRNIKFVLLNSDFDFSESHIRYSKDWFHFIFSRETRLIGSGLRQRLIISDNAPPMDGISLGAKFSNFEYRYSHFKLIGQPDSNVPVGAFTKIPPKYFVLQKFTLKPSWGDISYFHSIVYSGRELEFAYLNPLSFLKSIEHSLRDRDKTTMGFDFNINPFRNVQISGTWMLEDIIISKIGTGFWSNKTAWNIALKYSLPFSADIGLEYTRIEPYMFTHFNVQNNRTNDGYLFGTYLYPNSDETSLQFRWFWGNRYPLIFAIIYQRHGNNIYDNNGNLVRNVGGDPFYVRLPKDSETVTFLDGDRSNSLSFSINAGFELFRGFNLQCYYLLRITNDSPENIFKIYFRFADF
ncbi:MAG: hypothetical protein N2319_00275 [Candidatus Kapabacteria bacterium]|nr:hypothetical protein [Candidatus Kapabacteria bacterium]